MNKYMAIGISLASFFLVGYLMLSPDLKDYPGIQGGLSTILVFVGFYGFVYSWMKHEQEQTQKKKEEFDSKQKKYLASLSPEARDYELTTGWSWEWKSPSQWKEMFRQEEIIEGLSEKFVVEWNTDHSKMKQ